MLFNYFHYDRKYKMNELTKQKESLSAIPAVFDLFDMEKVSKKDEFFIKYKDGILEATVKREFGKVESVRRHIKGGFNEAVVFEPEKMDKNERNKLIRKLHANGDTQKELERKFGITQGMVSRIVNS